MSKYIITVIIENSVTTALFYKYLYTPLLATIKKLQEQLYQNELHIEELSYTLEHYKSQFAQECEKSIELNNTLTRYLEHNYDILE